MNDFPLHGDQDFDENANYNVLRGAAWLDETVPGWHNKIDTAELRMMDTHTCVLGQSIGHNAYCDLMDEHGTAWVLEYGFCMSSLRDLWIQQVNARLLADQLVPA